MAIKTFKPYTPARRNMTVSAFDGVDKKAKPERSLVETLKKNAGRNSMANGVPMKQIQEWLGYGNASA